MNIYHLMSIAMVAGTLSVQGYEKQCIVIDPAVRYAAPFGGKKPTYIFTSYPKANTLAGTLYGSRAQHCYVRLTLEDIDTAEAELRKLNGDLNIAAAPLSESIAGKIINDFKPVNQDMTIGKLRTFLAQWKAHITE